MWFTDSHVMVPGTVTRLSQFSEAHSVFTSSRFDIDPLRPLVAEGSDGSVNQKPGYDSS